MSPPSSAFSCRVENVCFVRVSSAYFTLRQCLPLEISAPSKHVLQPTSMSAKRVSAMPAHALRARVLALKLCRVRIWALLRMQIYPISNIKTNKPSNETTAIQHAHCHTRRRRSHCLRHRHGRTRRDQADDVATASSPSFDNDDGLYERVSRAWGRTVNWCSGVQ